MKKGLCIMFSIALCGTFLVGCNDGGGSNPEPKGPVYLPYDIDNTGSIKRFYANDENCVNIEIPATYSIDAEGRIISGNAYQIKTISEYCFANNNLAKTISIPDTITTIEKNAFYNCGNLEKINITSSISSIGADALEGCAKLTKIVNTGDSGIVLSENDNLSVFKIPSSVVEIGSNVFSGWDKLSSLTINEGITKVGDNSIKNNPKLAYVTVKSAIESLGSNVFTECPLLTTLKSTESSSGINFLKSQKFNKFIIPETITSVASQMFYGWDNLQEISIPASIHSLNNIFKGNSSLKKITCGNVMVLTMFYAITEGYPLDEDSTMYTVAHTLYSGAYKRYYYIPLTLTELHILNGEELESACCIGMKSLKSVYLPSTMTLFGRGAFANCSGLTDVHIQSNYGWCYSMDYYTSDYGQISQSTVNNVNAFASALKEHNGSYYTWYSLSRN